MDEVRKVRVLINPKSGLNLSFGAVQNVLDRYWEKPGIDLTYQVSKSREDGCAKVQRAVADGVDTVLVVGGDGMVNSLGAELIGTPVKLGVIPGGSGNGFARHFQIPLNWDEAAKVLAEADSNQIDVGRIDEKPFFITASMAWDAALVRTFEKFPFRGILPYAMAAVYEYFEYRSQQIEVEIDGDETILFPDPMVFTVANMTQFGGGAKIAPTAHASDGFLELVVIPQLQAGQTIQNVAKLFEGKLDTVEEVITRRFSRLKVRREKATPIQIDGELLDAGTEMLIDVLPKALNVLVPSV